MTDEQHRAADLVDHAPEVLAVASAQPAQRIRRSDDRLRLSEKLVVQTAKAGCVSERAVDGTVVGAAIANHLFCQEIAPDCD
jgi:hypothetical protein